MGSSCCCAAEKPPECPDQKIIIRPADPSGHEDDRYTEKAEFVDMQVSAGIKLKQPASVPSAAESTDTSESYQTSLYAKTANAAPPPNVYSKEEILRGDVVEESHSLGEGARRDNRATSLDHQSSHSVSRIPATKSLESLLESESDQENNVEKGSQYGEDAEGNDAHLSKKTGEVASETPKQRSMVDDKGYVPFVPKEKKQWPYVNAKLPAYSAGGPRGQPGMDVLPQDPFEPPDIGDACYLTHSETMGGTLKLHYAKATSDVTDRILGAITFPKPPPAFKYKTPTLVGQEVQSKPESLYRAVGAFVRAAVLGNGTIQFFPLPPGFRPFVVAYSLSDDAVKLQYAGDGPMAVGDCAAAAIADPLTMKHIQTATKLHYNIFKMQFTNAEHCCLLDFLHS